MRTPVFTGSCCALATPFDQNGNINYDAFGRLIDANPYFAIHADASTNLNFL